MSVRINGQPANLLVDTGSNEVILDAAAAESFGVQPSQPGSTKYFKTRLRLNHLARNRRNAVCAISAVAELMASCSRRIRAKPHSWQHEFRQRSCDAA